MKRSLLVLGVLAFSLIGCQKKQNSLGYEKKIGDSKHSFVVLDSTALKSKLKSPDWKSETKAASVDSAETRSTTAEDKSLYLAYPMGLLGHQSIFGGVITEVSNGVEEDLGNLKLANITPLHVKTMLGRFEDGSLGLALQGCIRDCTEESEEVILLAIPVLGVNEKEGQLILNLGALTKDLDLVSILDPTGMATQHKTKYVETVSVEFDMGILTFDIVSHMLPLAPPADGKTPQELQIKSRWYLRLSSVFTPAFKSREQVADVGFFTTERAAEPKITRFGLGAPIHYFIKNVPAEFQSAFAAAFEQWNEKLEPTFGKKIMSYQFIAENDPLNELIVAGDVRYNVVEWDLKNKASYGGFGPSMANQLTGEIFAAQTMIQGPVIVDLYTQWFESSRQAQALRSVGLEKDAEKLLAQTRARLSQKVQSLKQRRVELKLNSKLAFSVPAQNPQLMDALDSNLNFDEVPEGYDYARYMDGYLKEMVAHELGHNLGLRHNFKGNYGFTSKTEEGGTSHSVMEYLPRDYRHLNRVSRYDVMAFKYGYRGIQPDESGLFCTDENVFDLDEPLTTSAECSSEDASQDSFGYFQGILSKSVDLLIARGKPFASEWTLNEPQMVRKLQSSLRGLSAYALTSPTGVSKWMEFSKMPGRPQDPTQVREFVLGTLKNVLCDLSLVDEVARKESAEAKQITLAKISGLRTAAADFVSKLSRGLIKAEELACSTTLP